MRTLRLSPRICSGLWEADLLFGYKGRDLFFLTLLTAQTIVNVNLTRNVRKGVPEEDRYSTGLAVFLGEIVKLVSCFVYHHFYKGHPFDSSPFSPSLSQAFAVIVGATYSFQNMVTYWAMDNLNTVTYQLLYQFKILTTALLMWLWCNKIISDRQQFSLGLLFAGVLLVEYSDASAKGNPDGKENHIFGFLAVLVACFTSAGAGVGNERIVKDASVAITNMRIAMGAMPMAFLLAALDYHSSKHGLWHGFDDSRICYLILLQAFGGIIVANVVKHTDNIIKTFATTFSTVISFFISNYMKDTLELSWIFLCGAFLVIITPYIYIQEENKIKKEQQRQKQEEDVPLTGVKTV